MSQQLPGERGRTGGAQDGVGNQPPFPRTLGEAVLQGVETPQQLDALRDLGCEYAQGFLLGRPVPDREIEALLGLER